ncbi:MAG: CRTAC1 family protein [Gammaproteobacteria bacterium HGW-Gammaproteobacteria-2]|jgi:hypothetical protein|nr:MAG: CRTAC1 family protein [Gammaproteobacteria bacterium HGW-Gammaproteobacteria-2]
MKRWLWGIGLGVVLIAVAAGIAIVRMQGPAPEQVVSPVHFTEVPVAFSHQIDLAKDLPFMGSAAVDIDGDGRDEVILGGGGDQADVLLRFDGKGFTPIANSGLDKPAGEATFGMAAVDATGDGLSDLFIARSGGVYFYRNLGADAATRYAGERIAFTLDENTSPLAITLADIDHDGAVDLYVAGYIRQDHVQGETIFNAAYGGYSYLLHNNGDNSFTDITQAADLRRQHNTFMGVFADIDNDGWADLVIAQDTGVVEIQRNNGDLTFGSLSNPTSSYFSYPMGIGGGDYDNDGRMDFYFSNVGTTLPDLMVRGDLRPEQVLNKDYILLHNEGGLRFSDQAAAANAAKLGFGWGTVMHDIDNDGYQDLLIAQNYARFPGVKMLRLYRGHFLRQIAPGRFAAAEESAGLQNANFGITPLVSDFNGDGWPDVLFANLTQPARAFINDGGDAAWLQVVLPNAPAALAARVSVTRADGVVLHDQWLSGEGLASEQSRTLQFGLGNADGVVDVQVQFGDGRSQHYRHLPPRSVLSVDFPAPANTAQSP